MQLKSHPVSRNHATRIAPPNIYDRFESNIQGIPCLIEITEYLKVKGDPTTWASDWDFYGYTESEWNVRDRRGYRAAWLENKLTDADRERIEIEINEVMEAL